MTDIDRQPREGLDQLMALVSERRRVTYHDLNSAVTRLAARLQHFASPRSRVGISVASQHGYVASLLATLRLSAVPVILDPSWHADTRRRVQQDTPFECLVADNTRHATRVSTGSISGEISIRRHRTQNVVGDPDESVIFFTSGSTGHPKGVVHGNALLNAPYDSEASEHQVWFTSMPLWTISGYTVLAQALAVGGTLVSTDTFDPIRALSLWETEKVTVAAVSPQQLRVFARVQRLTRRSYAGLQMIGVGGGPLDPALGRAAAADFGCPVVETYGTTELGGGVAVMRTYSPDGSEGGGFLLDGVRIQIRAGTEGDIGEIECASPRSMLGYTNEPTRQLDLVETSDIARPDPDGTFTILGRADTVIARRDHKVFPDDIEHVLERHQAISRAGVIDIRVPDASGRPPQLVALIELEGETPAIDAVREYARTFLARYQVPDLYRVVARIPVTGSGKVDRRELRVLAERATRHV